MVFGSLCFSALSQQNTTASGGSSTGSGGSATYSVGQIDYIYASGATGNFSLGVQQVYEVEDVSGINELSSSITALFPNPTNGIMQLEVKNAEPEMNYELLDLSGRKIASSRILSTQTTIDISAVASGEYLLRVYSEKQTIKTLKIVKH